MKSVNLHADRFVYEAVASNLRGSAKSPEEALDIAVRYYLGDADSGRAAWRVPRHPDRSAAVEALELELDDELYDELRRDAKRQKVSPDLLALHALLYYLADLDCGRVAARLGDAIDRDAEAK